MHTSIYQCFDQLTAVKTGYPLTSITWPYRGLKSWPIKVKYFFEVIRWQVTSFQMIAGSSLIFFSFIWNMFCLWAAQLKFWFKTDLGPENSASYYRQDSCFWLCSPWSRVGHALHPFLKLWLVKIWQVSSCGKFMQHFESCLLWQLKLREFCVNLWCF